MVYFEEKINYINKKLDNGETLKRTEKIYFNNIKYFRSSNLKYVLTQDEIIEYSKCYNDIYYFIEKYFNITLREYQKNIIEQYKNRFSILYSSPQTGVNKIMIMIFIHYMIFNSNKVIYISNNKKLVSVEMNNRLKELYKKVPFFMQSGLTACNSENFKLENGCTLIFDSYQNVVEEYDVRVLNDYPQNENSIYIKEIVTASSRKDTKLILQSHFNGNDLFYKLVYDSERKPGDPLKNCWVTLRTYWWEVPNRNDEWKQKQIDIIGEEDFRKYYDLNF